MIQYTTQTKPVSQFKFNTCEVKPILEIHPSLYYWANTALQMFETVHIH